MRLLLDTNAFLWLMNEPEKLSSKARTACEDPDNELLLSTATAWEIQIKVQLGKLELDDPLPDIIERQRQRNNARLLPIELAHIFALADLEHHHRDPFDRLLIAQARVESAEAAPACCRTARALAARGRAEGSLLPAGTAPAPGHRLVPLRGPSPCVAISAGPGRSAARVLAGRARECPAGS